MTESSIMALIEDYTRYFRGRLQSEGLAVDADDIRSELSLVYVEVLRTWCQDKAAFTTYLIQSWKYAMSKMRRRLWREATTFISLANEIEWYPASFSTDERALTTDEIATILQTLRLPSRDRLSVLLAKEMVSPSDGIRDLIRLRKLKYSGVRGSNADSDKQFKEAFRLLYGIGYGAVDYRYRILKKKLDIVRKTLDFT